MKPTKHDREVAIGVVKRLWEANIIVGGIATDRPLNHEEEIDYI